MGWEKKLNGEEKVGWRRRVKRRWEVGEEGV